MAEDFCQRGLSNHEMSHTQENLGAFFAMAEENIHAAIAGSPLPTAYAAPDSPSA